MASDKPLKVFKLLKNQYPDAQCALNHSNAFQLLVATILSAQCTDQRVNMVTPNLFEKYPTPELLSKASLADVKKIIHSTGFYNNKAKNIVAMAKDLVKKHNSTIPNTLESLTSLAGVGRKTANVVLGNFFNQPAMVVDTHVSRLSQLIGLTKNTTPEKIEQDLMKHLPQETWVELSHLFITHGRRVCVANRPKCSECTINKICNFGLKKKT